MSQLDCSDKPKLADHFATGTLSLDGSTLSYSPWGRSVEISATDLDDVRRILTAPIQDENDVAAAFQWVEHWRGRSVLDSWLRKAGNA